MNFQIIPAIDLIEGKCVRLTQGDYQQKTIYNENPLEVAQQFEDAGLTHLHLVDLDGAKSGHIVNYPVLEKLATKTKLKIDFGGGLKANEDLKIAFECGASQITGGSIAVKNPTLFSDWILTYGTEKIILGADCKDGKIAVMGWQESSDLEVHDFIEDYIQKGISYCICTDIAKDGMLAGASIELYQQILTQNPTLKLIASGGVSSLADLIELQEAHLYGAIIGKAIYEGKITLKELYHFTQ